MNLHVIDFINIIVNINIVKYANLDRQINLIVHQNKRLIIYKINKVYKENKIR